MKFGVNTLLWTASFGQEDLPLLEKVKQWGFDGIEIARFSFDGFPARLLREEIRNAGLEPVFCSALTGELSLVSEDPAVRRAASDFVKRAVETAAELGSSLLVGPYLAPVGGLAGRRATEDEWKRGVDGIRALTGWLREHDVTLALEPLNRFETYVMTTAADARRFCDEIRDPYVGVLFDTFHANIEEKRLGDAIRALRCCHYRRRVRLIRQTRLAARREHLPSALSKNRLGHSSFLLTQIKQTSPPLS